MNNNNNNDNISNAGAGPIGSGPVHQDPQPNKTNINKILMIISVIVLLAGSAFGGVLYGNSQGKSSANKDNDKKAAAELALRNKPIDLPKEATVLNECVIGRGKQYILPKDIPLGPIYDVKGDKVIAIEYVLGVGALLKNPADFSDILMKLIKDNPVDHFSIVPQAPKLGDRDQFISLIMFVVPKTEAAKITCAAPAPGQ